MSKAIIAVQQRHCAGRTASHVALSGDEVDDAADDEQADECAYNRPDVHAPREAASIALDNDLGLIEDVDREQKRGAGGVDEGLGEGALHEHDVRRGRARHSECERGEGRPFGSSRRVALVGDAEANKVRGDGGERGDAADDSFCHESLQVSGRRALGVQLHGHSAAVHWQRWRRRSGRREGVKRTRASRNPRALRRQARWLRGAAVALVLTVGIVAAKFAPIVVAVARKSWVASVITATPSGP